MAAKDDKPGLLSKVAMFVRNPTKDWSELDQPLDGELNGYDKQALKAMIERKRQNDFVRKREFDQLRKLRNRDPGAMASVARPSFFQTSLPTDVGGRAVTLKKIDEIEAQMSRQWWKGKTDTAAAHVAAATNVQAAAGAASDAESRSPGESHSVPFASTEPASVRRADVGSSDADYLPTEMAPEMAHAARSGDGVFADDGRTGRADANTGFSTSRLFAIEADEIAADPELEEAAIRFANGDDAGAEKGLLSALASPDLALPDAQSWAAALLDLYRASGNQQAFMAAVDEFALHLDGVTPTWAALGAPAAARPMASAAEPIWRSPPELNAYGMEQLRSAMVSRPMPWYLDWASLERVVPDAMPLLDGLFGSLCDEAVSLRFSGAERVVQALRSLTPSGDRAVPQANWQVRLNALRAMGLQDDFELAALDYCVTFEVAPPAWVQPHCQLELGEPSQAAAVPDAARYGQPGSEPDVSMALRGEVVGDATQALSALEASPQAGARLIIACNDLVRVDFAAAGSILSWVAARQAEGRQVQFQDVHRLVAAFFNVIGINEYAKVVPRAI